jgi:hypothetical protein
MTQGNRTHLVARLSCGCMLMVMTKIDRDARRPYAATCSTIGEWYRAVGQAERRHKLTVTEENDPTEFKCEDARAGRKCGFTLAMQQTKKGAT